MIGFLIVLFIVGIIAGYLARLLVPGPDPMGFFATVLLGVVGSFVGGFVFSLLFDGEFELRPTNIIGSILGAIVALLVYRATIGKKSRDRV